MGIARGCRRRFMAEPPSTRQTQPPPSLPLSAALPIWERCVKLRAKLWRPQRQPQAAQAQRAPAPSPPPNSATPERCPTWCEQRCGALLREHGDAAAVLRERDIVMPRILRPLLAVGDRLDAVGIDAERDEIILHGVGATLAERQVVLARAALVAMALDRDRVLPVLLQPRRLLLERVLRIGADLIAVVVEEHAVADADLELLDRPGR